MAMVSQNVAYSQMCGRNVQGQHVRDGGRDRGFPHYSQAGVVAEPSGQFWITCRSVREEELLGCTSARLIERGVERWRSSWPGLVAALCDGVILAMLFR
jgi:hypothetical protein